MSKNEPLIDKNLDYISVAYLLQTNYKNGKMKWEEIRRR